MRKLLFLLCLVVAAAHAQEFDVQKVLQDSSYRHLKERIQVKFRGMQPGKFGEFVKGVDEDIVTKDKILALTFDACGGPHGSEFDRELIAYLKKEKIPATLFITGLWIKANPALFQELIREPLFEIENHGLEHHLCAAAGETKFGIHGTANVSDAMDEIEVNARQIEYYSHRKPVFYRSATAYTDEECATLARDLGETIISFDVLSGDAVPGTAAVQIKSNIVKGAKNGAIVIMHMNHPKWNGYEGLALAIPELKKEGYSFVKLEDHPLKGKQ